ncbi:adenine phosphoribosyltransferase [Frondihabitans sucicola]|uniref:Adenine phosphoribosyltransferase n=1 Tax=Frondihabitans sucicola TaxID=1268041 RepID=A0ABM8GMJ6_9MICO|nr:phosphoribosyltransferase family protein [Frondihabitans sucicola]BDZ49429.1 adenine phosphoribosyltransferase [Frondihabitans sucicola]
MSELRDRLKASFRWVGDRTDPDYRADVTGWWRDASILQEIGGALADLHIGSRPTVVLGTQSRGSLLGVLTANALSVGFVEVRKDPFRAADSDSWWKTSTAPDYRDRHLDLGLRRSLLQSGDRVLFVDDWIATGAQAEATWRLVDMSGAAWVGASVVVDGLEKSTVRRHLNLRSIIHIHDL